MVNYNIFTLVLTRPEGAPREAESEVLVEEALLWGGGGARGAAEGRVAATGAGGADADGTEVALERDRGGGGGVAAEFVPNRLKPFAERLAAAAATFPMPGLGRSSGRGSEEASTFYRGVGGRSY